MTVLVTGAAGFIGSNLVIRLLEGGHSVIGIDNLRRGSLENLGAPRGDPRFRFFQADMCDKTAYRRALSAAVRDGSIDEVWHMAANSDIPAGVADPRVDLNDTFMTTFHSLELMRELGIRRILFASSSAIYGDHGEVPIREDLGPLFPISNYGAMKLASEAAITAAAESFLERAYLFRFPNVIGVPATHGVLLDFVRKLKASDHRLDVLGDGSQRKSYLHVGDLIDAMMFIRGSSDKKINCYNIGPVDTGITVREIARITVEVVSPGAEIRFGKGNKGWVGDVPKFLYSTEALQSLGWTPRLGSRAAVERAAREIYAQEKESER